MTDTLFSRRRAVDLAELSWDDLDGAAEQWPRLFDLLATLRSERTVLGSVSGTLKLVCGSDSEPEHATWPLGTDLSDVEALRERVAKSSILPRPFEATLTCAPIVLLTDGQLHITDYDSIEQYSRGRATLAPTSEVATVDGLIPWRIEAADEKLSLLYFELSFGTPAFADGITAWARSHCDLWLPTRLDGEPNFPHGAANAQLLAECINRIAAAAGARLEM